MNGKTKIFIFSKNPLLTRYFNFNYLASGREGSREVSFQLDQVVEALVEALVAPAVEALVAPAVEVLVAPVVEVPVAPAVGTRVQTR